MTAQEMGTRFLILYDKITNFSAPGYESDEISYFLTKAQERVFNREYNFLGDKYREGFEETEFTKKDIKELVKGNSVSLVPSTSQLGTLPNGKFYDLPEDCLYVVSEEAIINSSNSCKNGTRVNVKPITHDFYSINTRNPFKKPTIQNFIWRLDYQGQKHELITDGTYTVAEYFIRYIERLQPIITDTVTIDGILGPLNCKLDESIHERIIDEAVKIATGITNPELYQIKTIEQQSGK